MGGKLRKLFAMSPREMLFRARHALALRRERRDFLAGRFAWSDADWVPRLCGTVGAPPTAAELADWWQRHMRERTEPPFLLAADSLDASVPIYCERFADRLDTLRHQADRAVAGHFAFLGIESTQHPTIDWHTDPKSGYVWQRAFHADLDFSFCREGGGDVKYVWELSRQEALLDCAKAARITGDERYRERVTEVFASWVAANPYLDGINWSSALEVAIRSFVWLWCYQFCRPLESLSATAHLDWIKALYHNGHYLHRHLSYYFSPNNHLIGEAAALYLIGCFLPEFDEAAAWREHGWRALTEYYRDQYYEDGGSTEQATFYHNYCLGFLLLAVLTRQRRGEPVPRRMLERIERALEFTMWMTRGDGRVPRIGDVDNARSIRFAELPLWDFRNLLSIGAILFSRGDMKAVAGELSEDALWLYGAEGLAAYEKLSAQPPEQTARAFPQSGYYVMRSGWDRDAHHLVFDAGPIAAGLFTADVPSSCHGHSDLMSVVLSVFGEPLLVDGGFYTYDEDPLWHRYFREASAHNTVLVDGASHAKFYASNAWSCVAQAEPLNSESTPLFEYVQSGHDGYYGLAPPVRHRRAVYWDRADNFLILDRLTGQGSHLVEVFFHVAPGATVATDSPQRITMSTKSGHTATLELLDNKDLQWEVVENREGPAGGWVGTAYGHRQRAAVVRFFGQLKLPASMSFCLSCTRNEAAPSAPRETAQAATEQMQAGP
ncbi:MAG: hypothetical protein DWQ31_20955 [Planctomycetota bacterium]|nr:MAG: hypothetical protein DWQ31_20955 [Planctomycetota bacterium]REJ88445.1 MAG: hypothetical protein DWQ35_19785 [Planctomycetota bacterium]REK22359.1 MAG: hypothetical protein DWQ42_17625 [Planctomycetota bacterium]REK43594.1 MAG: hypothetical protein DWQ46_10930 [Planctomycetota bacterium]